MPFSASAGDRPPEVREEAVDGFPHDADRLLRGRVDREGQLEGEIDEEAWFTEPALPADVFTDDPGQLWAHVLERMGSAYRLLARMPENPSWN